jgi:hypothetical protein
MEAEWLAIAAEKRQPSARRAKRTASAGTADGGLAGIPPGSHVKCASEQRHVSSRIAAVYDWPCASHEHRA